MKKVVTIFAVSMILISTEANACSICRPIAEAFDSLIEFLDKVACQKEQMIFARNGKYAQCRHGGKHQLQNFK
jgi:hypothetical protein